MPPGVGDRCGGRGPNPFWRFPPSPAQAGRVPSVARTGDWAVSWLCSRAVLVAEIDGRRPVRAFHLRRAASLPRIRSGLATQPRVRVVKGRWKPVPRWRHRGPGGMLLVIPRPPPSKAQAELGRARSESFGRRKSGRRRWYSSREGVLVPAKRLFLTGRPGRWSLAACPGLSVKLSPRGWLRQRTSEATLRAWYGRQRRHRETLRGGATIEAPPGPRGILDRSGTGASVSAAGIVESLLS